ncbi:MAG: PD-(D/E)XK nuclease family protein [Myxococcota bacterium]
MSGALLRNVEAARAWMAQWPRCTVVAPTRRAADAFVREAALERPVMGVNRRSLRQWVLEGGPQLRTSTLARRAELVRVVAETELEWFGEVASTPGFVAALDRTLDELRRFDIPVEHLEKVGPRGRDLAQLLHSYERAHTGTDEVDALRAPSRSDGPHLFLEIAPSDPLLKRRLADARSSGPWAALIRTRDPEALAWWSDGRSTERVVFDRPAELSFASVADVGSEAREVVRWLLRHTERSPFDRLAILLRHPSQQQAPLEAALASAGIPSFFARGVRRPHPAGRAVLALLRCGEEAQSASRFAEYLSFGQVPEPESQGRWAASNVDWVPPGDDGQLVFASRKEAEPLPPSPQAAVAHGGLDTLRRWERWITDAAVVGGVERWRRRLDGLRAEWTRNARSAADPSEQERLAEDIQSLRRLEAFALPVVESLADWSRARSWRDWRARLEALARLTLRSPEPVLSILAELAPLSGDGLVEAVELRAVLTEALGELREEPSRDPYGAVFIGTPEDAAGRSFDAVVLPGLTEGRFPVVLREDPLLPDAERERLREDLVLRPRQRQEERRAFARCLRAAPQVLLTYPRIADYDSESQVPSSFVLELWSQQHGLEADPLEAGPPSRSYGPGWRVPFDPAETVDEAEYDVAVAAGEASKTPGGAFYLREAGGNPHLARALEARVHRGFRRVSPADGLWARSDRLRDWLRSQAPKARIQSATSLESFAACPFKYWMHAVLRFRPRMDPSHPHVLHPLTKGSIFHEVLFELQQAEPKAERMLARVAEVVEAVGRRWFDELCPALPAVYWKTIADIEDDVRGWVRRAAERPRPRETVAAELAFGMPAHDRRDPASRAEALRLPTGHRLRGSVDRVERDEDGQLHIVDFKSGKVPERGFGPTSGGRQLQPLLYAEATEAILGRPVLGATLHYATLRAGFHERPALFLGAAERQGVLRQFFEQVDGQHEMGAFLPRPESGACGRCDYQPLCGPREEQRTAHKLDDEAGSAFARLERVRGMP